MSIISWGETPLISAIFSATDWIIGEQLRLPRQGSGARLVHAADRFDPRGPLFPLICPKVQNYFSFFRKNRLPVLA